jgi:hypothetical protein
MKWQYCTLSVISADFAKQAPHVTVVYGDGRVQKFEHSEGMTGPTFIASVLDQLGEEGWELASVNRLHGAEVVDVAVYYYFKREVSPS